MSEEAAAAQESEALEQPQDEQTYVPAEGGEHEAEEAKAESETGEEKAGDEEGKDDEPKKPRRRNRTDRHIRRLTREAREKAEEAAYWRGRFEASKDTQEPENQRPSRDDFDDYDEYIDALTDWKIEQRTGGKEQKQETKAPQRPPQEAVPPKGAEDFTARGLDVYGDDFNEAMSDPSLPVTEVMRDVMLEVEQGTDLYMYLYDNPSEAGRISNLSPSGQVRELDKLADKVRDYAADDEKPAQKPTKRKASKAPEPPNYERGGGEGPAKTDLDEIDDINEWMTRRNATKKTL